LNNKRSKSKRKAKERNLMSEEDLIRLAKSQSGNGQPGGAMSRPGAGASPGDNIYK